MKNGSTISTVPKSLRKLAKLLAVSFAVICLLSNTAYQNTDNYRMHCLYIYKFTQLVNWPTAKNTQEFTIGVIGVSPLLPKLQEYINAKNSISPVKYKLLRFANIQSATDCNILYICKDQLTTFENIVKKMAGKQTLLVSEVGGLIRKGSCINFISEEGSSIKIQVNKSAIESHKLIYSPELIRLANEVI